jgi:trk system potassium uptake protein TrkA
MRRYVVIGLGRFGSVIARRLAERGQDVLAIDRDERLVEEIKEHVGRAVVADATDPETLAALGVGEFPTAIVAIGEDREANILVSALMREIGIERVVARATSDLHARILTAVGVHKVVIPEVEYANELASSLVSSFAVERFPLAEGVLVAEIPIHPNMKGKTLRDLQLRERFEVNVVAVQSPSGPDTMRVATLPSPNQALSEGDILVVIGQEEAIENLAKEFRD